MKHNVETRARASKLALALVRALIRVHDISLPQAVVSQSGQGGLILSGRFLDENRMRIDISSDRPDSGLDSGLDSPKIHVFYMPKTTVVIFKTSVTSALSCVDKCDVKFLFATRYHDTSHALALLAPASRAQHPRDLSPTPYSPYQDQTTPKQQIQAQLRGAGFTLQDSEQLTALASATPIFNTFSIDATSDSEPGDSSSISSDVSSAAESKAAWTGQICSGQTGRNLPLVLPVLHPRALAVMTATTTCPSYTPLDTPIRTTKTIKPAAPRSDDKGDPNYKPRRLAPASKESDDDFEFAEIENPDPPQGSRKRKLIFVDDGNVSSGEQTKPKSQQAKPWLCKAKPSQNVGSSMALALASDISSQSQASKPGLGTHGIQALFQLYSLTISE
ncbi:hypothetical protein B0H10DRAFT_1962285 [Mycena sp. CBHHK59/15]|nr:hypothetical protein B0H10DRAFT_1962285 [Mycena sp. CBHHK59/15]